MAMLFLSTALPPNRPVKLLLPETVPPLLALASHLVIIDSYVRYAYTVLTSTPLLPLVRSKYYIIVFAPVMFLRE